MDNPELDQAASRIVNATNRVMEGLRLQRQRILKHSDEAPRLLEGTPEETVNLSDAPTCDLDYYIYEMGRLQDLARTTLEIFDHPSEVASALTAFDEAVPNPRKARNPLTHQGGDGRLDNMAWFSAFVRLEPGGKVEYLVDPRYSDHDAAEALAESLLASLRQYTRPSP